MTDSDGATVCTQTMTVTMDVMVVREDGTIEVVQGVQIKDLDEDALRRLVLGAKEGSQDGDSSDERGSGDPVGPDDRVEPITG